MRSQFQLSIQSMLGKAEDRDHNQVVVPFSSRKHVNSGLRTLVVNPGMFARLVPYWGRAAEPDPTKPPPRKRRKKSSMLTLTPLDLRVLSAVSIATPHIVAEVAECTASPVAAFDLPHADDDEITNLCSCYDCSTNKENFEVPCEMHESIAVEDVVCRLFHNPSLDSERKLLVGSSSYIVPFCSSFEISDISCFGQAVVHANSLHTRGFNLVSVDPPWENKSAHRGQKYKTVPLQSLVDMGAHVKNLFTTDAPSYVAVWVTNNPHLWQFTVETLLPAWGCKHISSWHWIKVTTAGELVCPLGSPHKKPYEPIAIGVHYPTDSWPNELPITTPIMLCSVPGPHSRKPSLYPVMQEFLLSQNTSSGATVKKCELFARYLEPETHSWGNQVLRFQSETYFKQQ